MAPVYRLASSELAANVQLVSSAERRRSPNSPTSDDLGRVPPPHGPAGTAREPAGEHRLDGAARRPARSVRSIRPACQRSRSGSSTRPHEHRAHGLVARVVRDQRRVDIRLMAVFRDPGDRLPAVVGVHRARGDRRLPADLVQAEAERRQRGARDGPAGLREDGRGAAEGIPDGLLDPAKVGSPRSASGSRRGTSRCSSSAWVEGELVHDRPLPAACAVRSAHVPDAPDGEVEAFVAAVALSFPRGESETPSTVIVGSTAFRRRRPAQHSRIRGAGETRAASAEPRLPEARLGSLPTPMSFTWR